MHSAHQTPDKGEVHELHCNEGAISPDTGMGLTVHRVQGMTLSTNVFVYLDGTFFANGQAYVALSRVKTFTQLHLLSFDPTKAIKVSQCVRGLYGMECNRSSEVTPGNNMPECTAADTATTTTTTTPQTETEPIQTEVSAAVSLPTIATAESLRYMLRNVRDMTC